MMFRCNKNVKINMGAPQVATNWRAIHFPQARINQLFCYDMSLEHEHRNGSTAPQLAVINVLMSNQSVLLKYNRVFVSDTKQSRADCALRSQWPAMISWPDAAVRHFVVTSAGHAAGCRHLGASCPRGLPYNGGGIVA